MLRQRRSFEFRASGVWSIWDVFTYLCESPWERCQIRIRSLKTDVESASDRCRWIFIYPQPTLHFFGPWQEAAVQGERNPHEEKRKPTLSQDSNQETSGRRPALTTTSTVRSNTDVCSERQKTLGDVSPVSIFSQHVSRWCVGNSRRMSARLGQGITYSEVCRRQESTGCGPSGALLKLGCNPDPFLDI